MLLLISSLLFLLHQCWLYKKPTAKVLVTFVLGNKNCKRAWRFPLETLPTTVCVDFSFLNLRCATANNNFFILLQFFSVLKYIYKYIQVCLLVYIVCLIQTSAFATWISCCHVVTWFFFFSFFSISGCGNHVQGSPWSIDYRSTLQNYNGYHEVRLPPKASKANAPSIENTPKKKLEGLKL